MAWVVAGVFQNVKSRGVQKKLNVKGWYYLDECSTENNLKSIVGGRRGSSEIKHQGMGDGGSLSKCDRQGGPEEIKC